MIPTVYKPVSSYGSGHADTRETDWETKTTESQQLAKFLDTKEGVNLDLCAFVEFDAIFKKHLLIICGGGE